MQTSGDIGITPEDVLRLTGDARGFQPELLKHLLGVELSTFNLIERLFHPCGGRGIAVHGRDHVDENLSFGSRGDGFPAAFQIAVADELFDDTGAGCRCADAS